MEQDNSAQDIRETEAYKKLIKEREEMLRRHDEELIDNECKLLDLLFGKKE